MKHAEKMRKKHIFECNRSKDYYLTTEKYKDLIKRGGPQNNMKSIEETAEAIR